MLFAIHLSAKTTDTLLHTRNSVRSVGVIFPSLNYPLLSPLNYSGYGITAHSTRFREKPTYLTQLQFGLELGLLRNDATDSYITMLALQSSWSRHWHVTDKSNGFRLLCGAAAGIGVDVYLKDVNTNNPVAYFFNLSASPSILAKYRFGVGSVKIDIGQQIDIPVASLVSMSGYSTPAPYAFMEKEVSFFDGLHVTSFGSLFKYTGITTIDFIPSRHYRPKWPTIRVSYLFSGINYQRNDISIKSINHMVLVGAIFRLSRY